MEPFSPEQYWITTRVMEVEGKKGKGRIKTWFDEETRKYEEKQLTFVEDQPCLPGE